MEKAYGKTMKTAAREASELSGLTITFDENQLVFEAKLEDLMVYDQKLSDSHKEHNTSMIKEMNQVVNQMKTIINEEMIGTLKQSSSGLNTSLEQYKNTLNTANELHKGHIDSIKETQKSLRETVNINQNMLKQANEAITLLAKRIKSMNLFPTFVHIKNLPAEALKKRSDMIKRARNSLAWIGIADHFLFLFLFF